MLAGAGAVFLKDVDAARAAEWVNGIRRDGVTVVLPDGVEVFRPSESAALLDVSPSAVATGIRRHNLPAVANGKARRLPRATVQALADRAARGAGPRTVNHHVRAVRGFFRWLVPPRPWSRSRPGSTRRGRRRCNPTPPTWPLRSAATSPESQPVHPSGAGRGGAGRGRVANVVRRCSAST
jgi:hypothetical protein